MNSYEQAPLADTFMGRVKDAFEHEYGVGSEQARAVLYEARKRKDLQPDAPKMRQMLGTYRTPQAVKAALGFEEDPDYNYARKRADAELRVKGAAQKLGTLGGAVAADLTQDSLRRFWWLLNAAQATGEVITEEALVKSRPDLYGTEPVLDDRGKPITYKDKKGATVTKTRRKFKPGYVQALSIPAGIAINTGLGLMTPFGGAEGYKAALPSDEDPSKTSNVIGEVAAKYFLGRTGNLLPYNEFVKARPDVSGDEYGRYKAFKFDKKTDLNPFDDGKVTLPTGVAKFTDEGIHGPELQFLGRSLPVTTGLIPFAGAVAGGALGVSNLGPTTGPLDSNKPIRRGFGGGLAGLAVGQIAGNIIENERRRRNTVENELDGTLR
eukprot:GHVR01149815.1.p1 GENE.GHVR01149815.1~~GHVR01149815.1.p1  ORF type:complete len:380 (-),score=71.56 GHVR01149815.1:394-1533(-)